MTQMLESPSIDLFRQCDHEIGIAMQWSLDGQANTLPLLGGSNCTTKAIRDFLPANEHHAAPRVPDSWWRR